MTRSDSEPDSTENEWTYSSEMNDGEDEFLNCDNISHVAVTENLIQEPNKVEDAPAIIKQQESKYTLKYTTYYNPKGFRAIGILFYLKKQSCK